MPSHEVRVVEARRQLLGVGGFPPDAPRAGNCLLLFKYSPCTLASFPPARPNPQRKLPETLFPPLSLSSYLSPSLFSYLSLSFSVLFCSISRSLSFFSVFLVIYVSLSLSFCLSTCFVRAVHVSTRWLHGFSRTVERWCRPRWLNTRMIQPLHTCSVDSSPGCFFVRLVHLVAPSGQHVHHLRPRRR